MRILFVSAPPLDRAFGGAKPVVELAAQFERLGWRPELVSLAEQVPESGARTRRARAEFLRDLLVAEGGAYDVVDFDHEYLPYARATLPAGTLFVARSVLLCQRVAASSFPRPLTARTVAGRLVRDPSRRANRREMATFATESIRNADVVNVCNHDDADLLADSGVAARKIVVFPFGLDDARLAELAREPSGRSGRPVVAFVGTFDWRKGASDMPRIVEGVARQAPETRFRLLGTRGMFASVDDVLRRFPRTVRTRVDVVPTFDTGELPGLLADCAMGFFPSYLEGFPFAVLEMLAASLPVVAYDVPGPRMMLYRDDLVAAGDADAMAGRIAALLRDPPALMEAQLEARRRAERFRWEDIARSTASVYAERLVHDRLGGVDVAQPAAEAGRAAP